MAPPTNGSLSRSEFWMRVAGACFAVWALMLPAGIAIVRNVFTEQQLAAQRVAADLTEYKLATERRLTLIEERQVRGQIAIDSTNARIAALERVAAGAQAIHERSR